MGTQPRPADDRSNTTFVQTFVDEQRDIDGENPTRAAVPIVGGGAREPWIARAERDRVGLALSGGGIRSASFSLGVLQAMADRRVLEHVDYLSTVSGGGYTGAFWMAWKRRKPPARGSFPGIGERESGASSTGGLEAPEVRHLREYSRFLAPRVGFLRLDVWEAVVAVLGGVIPTLALTAAGTATVLYAWRTYVVWLETRTSISASFDLAWLSLGVATLAWLAWQERSWARRAPRPDRRRLWGVIATTLGAVAPVLGLLAAFAWAPPTPQPTPSEIDFNGHLRQQQVTVSHLELSAELRVVVALVVAAGSLWALRFIVSGFGWWPRRWNRRQGGLAQPLSDALGRATARVLILAAAIAVLCLPWLLTDLLGLSNREAVADLIKSGGTTGALALVFGALGKLIPQQKRHDAGGLAFRLRPYLPQAFASLILVGYAFSIALVCRALVVWETERGWTPWSFVPFAVLLAAALIVVDFKASSLYEYYRRRIERAFVAGPVAGTDLFATDGAQLDALRTRPVHLVCCAANDVGGDTLCTLYRGARSAVVSIRGLTVGDATTPQEVRLSEAITASAAAFNSQMGATSVQLGPAVSILMTSMNLRLGLWLKGAGRRGAVWLTLPGIRLLTEMFGRTRADDNASWVHLSDGGHFDNLAVYELVRRHCRYIVACDSGADPLVRFDDLSELIRRVREDFGVEIDIDVTPLQPDADGRSIQHVAVGTVHYDGRCGVDKGVFILLKPTLTGDEPPDVVQYRARNSAFPHESTGDQFFDGPQWESYRRLGEHVGRNVFRYVLDLSDDQRKNVERVFTESQRVWQVLPREVEGAFLGLSERCAAMETELRTQLPVWLQREFAPEMVSGAPANEPPVADEAARVFVFMLQVVQLMEDAWLACRLDSHWTHPLNEGWMGYLQRWVAMPTFRRLWPLLRPVYSPGFREFMKRRFTLRVAGELADPTANTTLGFQLIAHEAQPPSGLAASLRPSAAELPDTPLFFTFEAERFAIGPQSIGSLQLGIAVIGFDAVKRRVSWVPGHVFVPPMLHGGGIMGRFLDALLERFDAQGYECSEVCIEQDGATEDLAETVRVLNLYRGRGFTVESARRSDSQEIRDSELRAGVTIMRRFRPEPKPAPRPEPQPEPLASEVQQNEDSRQSAE